jgi:hypothetical protein
MRVGRIQFLVENLNFQDKLDILLKMRLGSVAEQIYIGDVR